MTHSLQLRWTNRALSRLADILKHIAADNPAAANKLAKAMRSKSPEAQQIVKRSRSLR